MPETGAEQAERAHGIRQLKRLGFDVTVIAKVLSGVPEQNMQAAAREMGVRLVTVMYKYGNTAGSRTERFFRHLGKLRNPLYLDGAAYEFAESEIQNALESEVQRAKPDFIMFDYSYLWPLYHIARAHGIPIATRSLNFEPTHFLEEDGRSVSTYLRYVSKFLSELIVAWTSGVVIALSPYEADVYRRIGARRTVVLPLRSLPPLLRESHEIRAGRPLHVFFMGSAYTVGHNERALDFVTGYVAPRAEKEFPGEFIFHISGSKIPPKYLSRFNGTNLIFEGYIDADKFSAYLDAMDIALSPSPKKVGMQQKVYEPLCRGIPLITAPCNTGEYPLRDGEHFLAANTPEEYFQCLVKLRDAKLRTHLSEQSIKTSHELFAQSVIDKTLVDALKEYLRVTV